MPPWREPLRKAGADPFGDREITELIAPSWIFGGHDGILAVDIGGTNIRSGVVQLNGGKNGAKKAHNAGCARRSRADAHVPR